MLDRALLQRQMHHHKAFDDVIIAAPPVETLYAVRTHLLHIVRTTAKYEMSSRSQHLYLLHYLTFSSLPLLVYCFR